ncbi:hypothetical protein LINPERPRIM_LOCUS7354 [Linum perenne]
MNYKSILVSLAEKTGDEPVDVTLKDLGVRITCQEYEAGAFAVSGDTVIFSSYKDQRLYKQTVDGQGWRGLEKMCQKITHHHHHHLGLLKLLKVRKALNLES